MLPSVAANCNGRSLDYVFFKSASFVDELLLPKKNNISGAQSVYVPTEATAGPVRGWYAPEVMSSAQVRVRARCLYPICLNQFADKTRQAAVSIH